MFKLLILFFKSIFLILRGIFRTLQQASGKVPAHLAYNPKKFFTASEKALFKGIKKIEDKLDLFLMCNVRLSDVVVPVAKENYNRIAQMHVDFAFFDNKTDLPIFAIELDGKSHNSEKQQARDLKKDKVFAAAQIPLIRVKVPFDINNVWLSIPQEIRSREAVKR